MSPTNNFTKDFSNLVDQQSKLNQLEGKKIQTQLQLDIVLQKLNQLGSSQGFGEQTSQQRADLQLQSQTIVKQIKSIDDRMSKLSNKK